MRCHRFLLPAAIGLALALSLVGCANVPVIATPLAEASLCCVGGFDEIHFTAVRMGERKEFRLSSESPVMVLGGERGYLAGVELPSGTQGLVVQSPQGGFVPKSSYIDVRLVLLDAEKHVIEVRRDLPLREDKRVLFPIPPLLEWYFGTHVQLPLDVRYVLLLSRPGPGHVLYTHATTRPQPIPPSPVGTLAVVAL
jgi:hypothetical protein